MVDSKVYIHTHRSLDDILVLDVTDADKPQLDKVSVSSTTGSTPSARYCSWFSLTDKQLYVGSISVDASCCLSGSR